MDGLPERKVPTSMQEAVGGWLGIAESTLPFLVFTGVWAASGRDIMLGGIAAVSLTAVLAAIRIARRQTVQFALSGVLGIAFGAFVANRTGRAEETGEAFTFATQGDDPMVRDIEKVLGARIERRQRKGQPGHHDARPVENDNDSEEFQQAAHAQFLSAKPGRRISLE